MNLPLIGLLDINISTNSKFKDLYGNQLPSKKFMAMFKGLIDGDGYIEIGEQKQSHKKTKELVCSTIRCKLSLRLNVRDIKLINYIKDTLLIGNIDLIENKTIIRYRIYKNDLKNVL
jgi:hypothetical protein